MGFTAIDYVIVFVYLIGVAVFGILTGGKQNSVKDYFVGGRKIPWLAVSFAVVATETSAITFISVPGLAYLTNLNFLQIAIGYIIGRIAIAILFLPSYYRGELVTAYELLKTRFGDKTRNYASIVFLVTRTLATGVRLFTTAIPLAIIFKAYKIFTGYPDTFVYAIAIIAITVFTFAYTYTGGIKAVIWTERHSNVYLCWRSIAGVIHNVVPSSRRLEHSSRHGIGEDEVSIRRLGVQRRTRTLFHD